MIDIHCHILPGVDDGAKDIENSIEMVKIAYEDGIKKIIATPHFHRSHYENAFDNVKEKVENLNEELKRNGIGVHIIPGQEIFLDNYTLEQYKKGTIKPIDGKKYMLLELDFIEFPKHALDIIYELKVLGIKTIIAHPERYVYFYKDVCQINSFIEEGCMFQINSGSITGLYGKEAQKIAKFLVEKGLCDFIGSDAHSTGRRKPQLKEAYNWIEKNHPKAYQNIVKNAECLLNAQEINVIHEKVEENKGFLHRIFRY